MSNDGAFSGLPIPNNSYTGNPPIVPNDTVVATAQWAQPQLQGQNIAPPAINAFNAVADEYRPPGMPVQTWNVNFHAQAPPLDIPQLWAAYGQHLPAPNYYGGYPGPQTYGPPHYGQMHAPAAPQMHPTGAPQLHVDAAPQAYAPAMHNQEVPQAPPHTFLLCLLLGHNITSNSPAEGSFTRSLKRKAVGDAETPQQKQKRHRPQGDPDFELVQPGADGKPRWKCLKLACAHVNPMLEVSIHKHVTATRSHQQGSAVPQADFKRKDALDRHRPSGQCVKNRQKLHLEGTQANVQVAGTSTIAAVPSFSGSAASSETQQLSLLPVATPTDVHAAGSSTSQAAAPVAMHQQHQFTFRVHGPEPSSVIQHSGVQATQTGGTWMIPRTSYAQQEVLSFPVQPNVQNAETSIQQPAAARPSSATEADFSTTDQTSAPFPSATPYSSNGLPFVAGDFSLSIFERAAKSLTPSPSEDVEDSSGDLFSAPASPVRHLLAIPRLLQTFYLQRLTRPLRDRLPPSLRM
ncbi:hypothetical protein BDR07DRAFT_1381750 [Suillus spraguei]|nr:hypothetical protein BDR07DRAFT_1381750 [Suillus spraguei]